MNPISGLVGATVTRILGRMRYPSLFLLTGSLFLLDLLIPDLIPFVDEIVLGLITMALGAWRERKVPPVGGAAASNDAAKPD